MQPLTHFLHPPNEIGKRTGDRKNKIHGLRSRYFIRTEKDRKIVTVIKELAYTKQETHYAIAHHSGCPDNSWAVVPRQLSPCIYAEHEATWDGILVCQLGVSCVSPHLHPSLLNGGVRIRRVLNVVQTLRIDS